MLKLIIILGIIYFFYWKFKPKLKIFFDAAQHVANGINHQDNASVHHTAESDMMIKDPMCGAYFPKRNGVHLNKNGEDLYFCSPECKDDFLSSRTSSSNTTNGK